MKKVIWISVTVFFILLTNGLYAVTSKFFIGDNNNGRIATVNIDGTGFDTVDIGKYFSFYDADVDPVNKKIYMSWYYGIYKMNYDGSDLDTIINYPSGGYSSGIAVDAVGGKIYWGSTQENTIYRANLDGTGISAIYTNATYVGDVDLDLVNGHIYYGGYIVTAGKGLHRIDLNGSNHTVIAAGYDVAYLAIDTKNETIYFADGGKSRRIKFDGSNDTILFNFQPGGFWVDTISSKVYITDMSNNRLVSCDLDGTNIQNVINTNLDSPHGPVYIQNACGVSVALQPANQSVTAGDNVSLSITSVGNVTDYQWQQDGGTGFVNLSNAGLYSGVKTNTLTISNVTSTLDNYAYRCIISNGSCSDTSDVAMLSVIVTSVFEKAQKQKYFAIYPNPSNGIFNISTDMKNMPATIRFADISGKIFNKINTVNIGDHSFEIHGAVGVYLIQITTKDGYTETIRFIKN